MEKNVLLRRFQRTEWLGDGVRGTHSPLGCLESGESVFSSVKVFHLKI